MSEIAAALGRIMVAVASEHLLRARREHRTVEHHGIGQLPDLYAPLALLLEAGVGPVLGKGADGLQYRNLLVLSHRNA
jgi:hypothetical protein